MPKFLTVLNKDEVALGYLTGARNVEIRERLNGEALLSFEIPFDTDDARYLELEGYVKFNGQLYVIKSIEQSDDGRRNLVVRAVHVYVELVDEYIDRVIELFGNLDGSLQNAVNEVLRDTHFVAGTVTSVDVHDFTIYEVNALKALQEIAELWNIDVWFDNRTVHLGTRGDFRNVEIRYGKNLKSLSMPTSSENIITRLYVYGKDGLTIEGVNNGVKYIDSPYIGNYKRPKCGDVRFNDIDDANELLAKAQAHLDKVDKPEVSYAVDFVYLSKLGYDVYDDIQIGDRVIITHAPFGIDRLELRVTEYTYYPFEPKVGSVTLSNTKDSLIDVLVALAKTKNTVAKALDKNGRVQTTKLDAAIQQATKAINDAQTELEFDENGVTARDPNDSNRFTRLNSAGIGITTDGTLFKEVMTPDGLVITKGTVGRLDADVITIGGGTAFEDGYDPSTKATIADAEQAAQAVANAAAAVAQANAEAYADGIVSAEEQARINDATAKLTEAKTHANTVAATAETNAKNASVPKGVKFDNSVVIGDGSGIKVVDSSNVERVMLGQYSPGNYGLLVKGGEIYGTRVQTNEGNTYVVMNPNGTLECVYNGRPVIQMTSKPGEGRIYFFAADGLWTASISAAGTYTSNYDGVNYSDMLSISNVEGNGVHIGGVNASIETFENGSISISAPQGVWINGVKRF